jgi:hypothetical protein
MAVALDLEIICIDDASTTFTASNSTISTLSNCSYELLPKNIGRSQIRNLLATKAAYDWLLFLDCDTFPQSSTFIATYCNQIKKNSFKALFGGLLYSPTQPANNQLLRWKYGHRREALSVENRKKQPYVASFVSNFLILKSVFYAGPFSDAITTYGFEDFVFIQNLKEKNIAIEQIENPVFHQNLESSLLFLSKTKEALQTLFYLNQNKKKVLTKLTRTYSILKKVGLIALISFIFQKTEPLLEKNLLSKKPSLFAFDLYKIGYFCYLNHQ